jgi:hypothetical protein
MARTAQGAALTAAHRQAQLALRAQVIRDVIKLYPAWRPSDPASYQAFEEALVLLTQARIKDSAAIAARYYELFALADSPVPARMVVPLTYLSSDAEIRAAISATARAGVYRALGAGMGYEQAMANGLVEVSGAVSRVVANGGRDTVIAAVKRDPKAQGWARATSGKPCAFCAMLASRGPVYKEETVGFQAHDHCSCSAEPAYEGSEWPGNGRQYQEMWKQVGSLNGLRRMMDGKTTW